ncbi:hypothetical protein EDB87DRAFT_1099608 [Lactarius vividus]|nr:hypothetical protein EDB87DRAFT_1099608 [Lactarius vividus]
MPIILFELAACVTVVGCSTVLAVLRHGFRQRCLHKIPGPSNPSLFSGHLHHIFNPYAHSFHEGLYKTYGTVARVYGVSGDIKLVVSDPKARYDIFIMDQALFQKPEALTLYMQTFGPAIVSTSGAHHRRQRKMLNPVFGVGHMRHTMTPIFHWVARQVLLVPCCTNPWKSRVNCIGWPSRDQHRRLDRQVCARTLRRVWSRVFLRYS